MKAFDTGLSILLVYSAATLTAVAETYSERKELKYCAGPTVSGISTLLAITRSGLIWSHLRRNPPKTPSLVAIINAVRHAPRSVASSAHPRGAA